MTERSPPARRWEQNARASDAGVQDDAGSLPGDRTDPTHALFEARALVRRTAQRCAMLSGALALRTETPRRALVPPELLSIGRLQADMVAEIGKLFHKDGKLIEGALFFCVLRHAAAQFLRELAIYAGEKITAEREHATAARQCQSRTREIIEAPPPRRNPGWWSFLGAVAVAAFAFYDASRVGADAVEFFRRDASSP